MKDDASPGSVDRADITDVTDVTDNSLITDFTQVVSCAVGRDRVERRREKIRAELIREHINNESPEPTSLLSQLFNVFRR